MRATHAIALALAASTFSGTAEAARLKDLVEVEGFRPNALVGVGIVVGLKGTGDDAGSFLARRPLSTLLKSLGSAVEAGDIKARNVAIVTVTAELPPYARAGTQIDVNVASIGTAKSLEGGTLIATALKGLDRQTYAIAQGQLVLGGYDVGSLAGSVERKNHVTAGRVPHGATVEREVENQLPEDVLLLTLHEPDFTTAARIKAAVDLEIGEGTAEVKDPGAVSVKIAGDWAGKTVELIAKLEAIEASPDAPARVIIDEKSGTIVVGGHVSIGAVAIAYGGIHIKVQERFAVSQPSSFGRGRTVITPDSNISVEEAAGKAQTMPEATTVADIAAALNALGVKPRDLVPIFQALKAAGALTAEIKVL
ncbi:MAG: flagellar basal body P-ring protein FlgI [Myxococcota bacterium]